MPPSPLRSLSSGRAKLRILARIIYQIPDNIQTKKSDDYFRGFSISSFAVAWIPSFELIAAWYKVVVAQSGMQMGQASNRQVTVIPYDPQWPASFERSAREVKAALGDNLLVIHHIGSTSIPGIHAKPIIDMLAVASDLRGIDDYADRMGRIGYEGMGEFGISGRRYFRRDNSAGVRTEQVHVFAMESPHVSRHLAFRDFLRSHPKLAQEYSQLKQRLAAAYPLNIEAYMDGKDPFIRQAEAKALEWAALHLRVATTMHNS